MSLFLATVASAAEPEPAPGTPGLVCLCLLPRAQVVSERLSAHVMAHYAQFVDGIEEVTRVQADLQVGAARERGRGP